MSDDGIFVPPEEPPITNEGELVADAEFSKLEKSDAYVEINVNWAKILLIWAGAAAGSAFILFCAAMLVCLLHGKTQHLLSNPELLTDFLSALWEALKNGAAVSFPILLYFARRKRQR